MKKKEFTLQPIGYVESSFKKLEDCPHQGDQTCPPARIHIAPDFARGLEKLEPGREVIVVSLLHMALRDKLQCRPRNDPGKPVHGVFATRSPNRPNPLGLHQVKIISLDQNVLLVHPLEVLDRTPVIDIRPVLGSDESCHEIFRFFTFAQVDYFMRCSRQAWAKGLVNGLNGNFSMRKGELVMITAAGSAKGMLERDDLCVIDLATEKKIYGFKEPSSEAGMHCALYKNQPRAGAVAHTHPVNILTLDGLTGDDLLRNIDMFEARAVKSQLASVPEMIPGTWKLADAVGLQARQYKCIIMRSHGLTCWAETLSQAVALCDELEALAAVELNTQVLSSR